MVARGLIDREPSSRDAGKSPVECDADLERPGSMRSRRRRWILGGLFLSAVLLAGTPGLSRSIRWLGDATGHPAPALPAALFDMVRFDPDLDATASPATPAGERVLATLAEVERRQRRTRYQHHTAVHEGRGQYFWDCSGMVSWVLRRAAPRAHAGLGRERPLAMRYARVIADAPTDRPRRGWQRVRVADVRPGDVFAWETTLERFRRQATGHVGFVVSAPARVRDDLWAVRIVERRRAETEAAKDAAEGAQA